ncbi:Phosphatidylinositol-binding clathrin assembly protein [Bagarius yarrelli]|uniref:Phosphatidylinositol-binding clathrin assembly protein n=1 Tax=Bagarius yarrelli TaxID=175774 RepID=A0A556U6G3_BAGYA|nr:Phosphatidylinositol-binding clathrin assembly protein [Bagarius yarrelli]
MSGQTLTDRIAAAQYSLTGSEVARAVCKATTHEVMAPKKKHLEYLIQATQESNVNITPMADTLFGRAGNASWIVVFKALVSTHHLMVHGNERFIQFLASRNTLFNLSNFLDKTGSHGYDMSTFIRRYSRYLNEKAFSYRQMAFDFGRVKKGFVSEQQQITTNGYQLTVCVCVFFRNEGVMRTMATDKLLKGMFTLQSQIDALLEFDKFFQMKKGQCKDALEIYKRFLTRMTRVSEFLKIAEQVGIDKSDIPEPTQAPESLLESLETHLNTLEGKRGQFSELVDFDLLAPSAGASAAPVSAWGGETTAVSSSSALLSESESVAPAEVTEESKAATVEPVLNANATSLPSIGTNASVGVPAPSSSLSDVDLFGDPWAPTEGSVEIAPELDLFAMKPAEGSTESPDNEEPSTTPTVTPENAPETTPPAPPAHTTEPAASPAPAAPMAPAALDIFGDMFDSVPEQSASSESKAAVTPTNVDLFGAGLISPVAPTPTPVPTVTTASVAPCDLLDSGFDAFVPPPASSLTSDPVPASTAPCGGFDASATATATPATMPTSPAMMPTSPAMMPTGAQPAKAMSIDLDESLANLVGIMCVCVYAWCRDGEKKLTGGVNWTPQVAPTSWSASSMAGATSGAPPTGAMPAPMGTQPGFSLPPAGAPMMPQQQMMMGQSMMRPPFAGAAAPVKISIHIKNKCVFVLIYTFVYLLCVCVCVCVCVPQLSPGPAVQSLKKPQTKDPLADLNIKDFL